jgi:hypothetical protein
MRFKALRLGLLERQLPTPKYRSKSYEPTALFSSIPLEDVSGISLFRELHTTSEPGKPHGEYRQVPQINLYMHPRAAFQRSFSSLFYDFILLPPQKRVNRCEIE